MWDGGEMSSSDVGSENLKLDELKRQEAEECDEIERDLQIAHREAIARVRRLEAHKLRVQYMRAEDLRAHTGCRFPRIDGEDNRQTEICTPQPPGLLAQQRLTTKQHGHHNSLQADRENVNYEKEWEHFWEQKRGREIEDIDSEKLDVSHRDILEKRKRQEAKEREEIERELQEAHREAIERARRHDELRAHELRAQDMRAEDLRTHTERRSPRLDGEDNRHTEIRTPRPPGLLAQHGLTTKQHGYHNSLQTDREKVDREKERERERGREKERERERQREKERERERKREKEQKREREREMERERKREREHEKEQEREREREREREKEHEREREKERQRERERERECKREHEKEHQREQELKHFERLFWLEYHHDKLLSSQTYLWHII